MPVRIGIDVGGTFTDAVVIDNDSFELIGKVKVPTTHTSPQGVAAGIIQALRSALAKYNLSPDDVVFIAHGTTQATNALLEGDVEPVGIIGLGSGLEGFKVKSDTFIEDIELAPNRYLRCSHTYVDTGASAGEAVTKALERYAEEGIRVVVASGAYSVDDPSQELAVVEMARSAGMLGSGSHEISKLYGLKMRTRTAVINASILPKMVQTANMTEASVRNAAIKAPLMIMRCDGGVMNIEEVKQRPILTMLSGPAAGVAGALMYEKISEGIFLEVGGTSTDISAIHNGQVLVSYAEVGGHKTYVNSLDVRTVGVAGGSMIRIRDGKVVDVGPRSAHIAGLPYVVFSDPREMAELEVVFIKPLPGDYDDYVALRDKKTGKLFAPTLSCAANAAGYVQAEHYCCGNKEAAIKAFSVLAEHVGMPGEQLLQEVQRLAAIKNARVVNQLIADYGLDRQNIVLVGGGGGCAAVVPFLAEELQMAYKIAKNAEVISPIGVALAMVRDIVERTINNPSEEDIIRLRREAEQSVLKAGASPGTIEITIEVDSRTNLVRAIATGATELRTGDCLRQIKSVDELTQMAEQSFPAGTANVELSARSDHFLVFQGKVRKSSFFGLLSSFTYPTMVVTWEGVIRLKKTHAKIATAPARNAEAVLKAIVADMTEYGDSEKLPEVFVLAGARIIDLSGLVSFEQIVTVLRSELAGLDNDLELIFTVCKKS